jgi:hypothetical protein
MTPFFTVPPVPHFFFRVAAIRFNPDSSIGMPLTVLTPFPFRPLVDRPILIIPSLFKWLAARLQRHRSDRFLHVGQTPLLSVEYTNLAFLFFIGTLSKKVSGQSSLFEHWLEMGQTLTAGLFRLFGIWIEFKAHVVWIATAFHRLENGREVDGTAAGDEMVVFSGGGDIFDMDVTDPGKQLLESRGRVFTHTVKMANVKVNANDGILNFLYKRFDLTFSFHQQVRFRFDEKLDTQFDGRWDDLIHTLMKQFQRFFAGYILGQRPSRWNGDVRASEEAGNL